MRLLSSLITKVIFWFFLNLVLLATILGALFAIQSQFDLHSILGRDTNDRIRATGRQIAYEIRQETDRNWNDILAQHAQFQGVDFVLFMGGGSMFSSKQMKIPDNVIRLVKDTINRRPPHRIDTERFRRPIRRKKDIRRFERGGKPQLHIKTNDPTLYWTGVILRMPPNFQEPGQPIVLLAVSDSVTGHGYFFDPLPWFIITIIVVVLSALMWIPFVRHITSPLKSITSAAEQIARGKFDIKVQETRVDEIGRLGKAINHMTTRLEGYVIGQKRFIRDIAHELGSPLARINFGLGSLEQRIDPENRERLEGIIEDVDHLSNLVNEILSFTKAEMNPEKIVLKKVNLLPLIERAIRTECDKNHPVLVDVDPGLTVFADSELLTRAMANIIRNALNYAGQDKPIQVVATSLNNKVKLVFQDRGPGVPEHQIHHLFEPFYRPEKSRSQESGGVGLGLAIVKTCIETCNGSVSAENMAQGGFAVTLTLFTDT